MPGQSGPHRQRALLDHRPARRHPRIWRGAERLGGACRAVGRRAAGDRRGGAAGAGAALPLGRAAGRRAGPGAAGDRGQPHPAAGDRAGARGGARTPSSGRWARPARRRWRWSAARRTSTSMPAASINGTIARRPRWRSGLGLHASRIDGAPLVYNGPDTNVPDLLIGRPRPRRARHRLRQRKALSARQAASFFSNGRLA